MGWWQQGGGVVRGMGRCAAATSLQGSLAWQGGRQQQLMVLVMLLRVLPLPPNSSRGRRAAAT
jgi:hypothetical protein